MIFSKRGKCDLFWFLNYSGVILIITLFILFSAYNRYLIARDMAERRFAVEAEIHALEERRQKLDEEVKYLSNERGVEAEMRRQFDITREGEQLVILLDENEKRLRMRLQIRFQLRHAPGIAFGK